MLNSSLCDYSDAYSLVKGTITVAPQGDNPNNEDKIVVFENCTPYTDCISEINNTQLDNAEDIDVVTPMYNLIEYSNNLILKMSLINCEINLILTWSKKCVLSNDTKATTFVITDTKPYVPVVTLST